MNPTVKHLRSNSSLIMKKCFDSSLCKGVTCCWLVLSSNDYYMCRLASMQDAVNILANEIHVTYRETPLCFWLNNRKILYKTNLSAFYHWWNFPNRITQLLKWHSFSLLSNVHDRQILFQFVSFVFHRHRAAENNAPLAIYWSSGELCH